MKILNDHSNTKHKAILYLIYSSGLRVSEVVRLKAKDIDSKRMMIYIVRVCAPNIKKVL
ncbi:tyrosine-type recombinase/integrase [Proteiniborus sp.]|uniref:tyrosine-type recombinase/integrase n=1 Tax=Proteiniborus sp. TaxID=2079015 RepID=UPI00332FC581